MIFGHGTNSILRRRIFKRRASRFFRVVRTFILLIGFTSALYYVIQRRQVSGEHDVDLKEFSTADSRIDDLVAGVLTAIDEGNYQLAKTKIEGNLKINPNDSAMQELWTLLMKDLQIDFKFNYLPDRRQHITTRGASPEIVLTPKDPYYLSAHASDKCFLYLFQLQSSGELTILFPNLKYVPTSNPVPGGPIRIPDGYEWFYLDNVPGIETIYLIASHWRQKEIEALNGRLDSEQDAEEKAGIIEQILMRLHREEQQTEALPGLVSAKYRFRHEISLQ